MSDYSFQFYCAMFFALYTGERTQIMITTLASIANKVIVETLLFKEEITASYIFARLMTTFFLLVFLMALAMMIKYMEILQMRLQELNIGNTKLLDGMHEGLLILSQSTNQVLFSNKPSQKLLEGVLSFWTE